MSGGVGLGGAGGLGIVPRAREKEGTLIAALNQNYLHRAQDHPFQDKHQNFIIRLFF